MVATILVPLDGSPLAERAVPYASRIARTTGGELLLVRAASAFISGTELERDLNEAAERLRSDGLEVQTRLLPIFAGGVAQAIVDFAAERQVAMIVMSTHGRGGLGRWLFGSVADQVLRRAEMPVILVPAATDHTWATERPPRILVPLDGSALAEEVLPGVTDLAKTLGATLLLVQVVEILPSMYTAYPSAAYNLDAQVPGAEEYLEGVARTLRDAGLTAEIYAPIGYASGTIATAAAERDIDLIAMATHGRGGFARLVLGSVATGTLQRTHTPVLLLHPRPAPGLAAPAAEEVTVESVPEPVGPAIDVSLTARELQLIERGLTSLIFMPGQNWRGAAPVRELLARIKAVDEGLGSEASSAKPR